MFKVAKSIKSLEKLTNLQFVDQALDQIQFLHSSKVFKTTLLEQIALAKNRIYITALYFEQDEAGEEILTALYQKKLQNPNIEIKILIDWHRAQRGRIGEATRQTNANWYHQFKQKFNLPENQEIEFWGVPINNREVLGVLHLKGFIIDDKILYSGASINNVYLHQLEKYRFDRYHLIKNEIIANAMVNLLNNQLIADPAVTRLDNSKRSKISNLKKYIKNFRGKLKAVKFQLPTDLSNESNLKIAPLVGIKPKNELNNVIENLFYAVEKQIVICTPYFNFPIAVQKQIKRLVSNGKNVTIVVGDKTTSDFYQESEENFNISCALPYLYEKNLRKFAQKFDKFIQNKSLTIKIWKDTGHSFHVKGLWVDDKFILLTGHNLNPRAFRLDYENGLLIYDPNQQLQDKAQTELEFIYQHTKILNSYLEIEDSVNYPPKVSTVLKRFERVQLDKIVKLLL